MPLDVDQIEREVRGISDPNEAVLCILRVLEVPKVSQYIENNASVRNTLVAKLSEVRCTEMMTPAPTPPSGGVQAHMSPCSPLTNDLCGARGGDNDTTGFPSSGAEKLHTGDEAQDFSTPGDCMHTSPLHQGCSGPYGDSLDPHLQGASKRKRDFEHTRPSKRPETAIEEASQASLMTSSTGPLTRTQGSRVRTKKKNTEALDFGQEVFAKLPSTLRARVQQINAHEDLQDAWRFCFSLRQGLGSMTHSQSIGPLQQTGTLRIPELSDSRPKQLRHLIENWDELVFSNSAATMYYKVAKRVNLIELADRFRELKTTIWAINTQDTANDRFCDELFPETIVSRGMTRTQPEKAIRTKKKRKVEYWVRLGTRFGDMVQRFGYGVLLFPARHLADRHVNNLSVEDVQKFLDYIDLCHPGLKDRLTNLSNILPQAIHHGLPLQLLTIETISYDKLVEIRGYPLDDMFRYSGRAITLPPIGEPILDDDTSNLLGCTLPPSSHGFAVESGVSSSRDEDTQVAGCATSLPPSSQSSPDDSSDL